MDDVLDGKWSVKVNGLDGGNDVVYQTIPQNFRFEPGVAYKVSFDYQAGSDDIYAVIVGNGEHEKGKGALTPLKKALGTTAHYSQIVVGAESGQTWFGIYSTSESPDFQGATGSAQAFGGYMDIVLDNLVIEKTVIDKTVLEELVAEVKTSYEESVYTEDTWKAVADALTAADKVLANEKATEVEITKAYSVLKEAVAGLVKYNPAADEKNDISVEGVVVTAGSEDKAGKFGSNGAKEFVIDGNEETAWFTDYDEYGSELKNAWIDLQYPEAHTVDGFRYLPAQNEPNYGGGITPVVAYEIWVKTADSDEYQKAAEGEWESNLEWKMAAFEPIENVTNVKMVVKGAGTSNWWGQAAEIRALSAAEAAGLPE